MKSYLIIDINNQTIIGVAKDFNSLLNKISEVKNLDSIKEIKLLDYPTYV